MTLDGFKDACKSLFDPYRDRRDITIHDVLALHERLLGLAQTEAFPHKPQLMTIGLMCYCVMVDDTGRYGSFSLN